MTTDTAKEAAHEYRWPLAMAAIGAGLLGLSLSWEAVKDPATVGAIATGLISLVQWVQKRGEKKTVESVEWQKLLAGLAIGERLDALQADLSAKHKQNLETLSALSRDETENARLHTEHIAVTDSHAAALIALEGIGRKVDETFALPPLHQRQPPASEAGNAERAA